MEFDSLKIVFWNCRSICNKIYEFFNFMDRNNFDLCLLTETWLKTGVKFSHPNYKIIRRDRDSIGGGVAIIIKKSIKFLEIRNIATKLIENVGVEIMFEDQTSIKIFGVYFPGGASCDQRRNEYKSDLRKLLGTTGKYIFCGDFNSRHRNWGCVRANSWGNILNEMTTFFPITISHSYSPTYIPTVSSSTPSTLDLLLTNVPFLISPLTTLNKLYSDHLPVSFTIEAETSRTEHRHYNFNKADWGKYKTISRNSFGSLEMSEELLDNPPQIDGAIDRFTSILSESVRLSVPLVRQNTNFFKLPEYILDLIRIRNYHKREWSRYRQTSDYIQMYSYNIKIRSEITLFRNRQWSRKLMSLDKSSRPFWNLTKVLKKKNNNVPPLKVNSQINYTCKEKANCLANSFVRNHHTSDNLSTLQHINLVKDAVLQFDIQSYSTPPSEYTTTDTVCSLIRNLKTRKAMGFDNINNRMLKQLPLLGFKYLTYIFNSCIKLQYYPTPWKAARVVPIHKPGKPPDDPGSYRPISLLSSVSKIFEKIIKSILDKYLESNNIIPREQFGFRKYHSTSHQVMRIRNHVKENFSNGNSTALVLLDVAKAFDSIWHDGLIFKMINFGFPPFLIKILKCFLKGRSFQVSINNDLSDPMEISSGVPQGTVIGPVLYNIYLSDFPELLPCHYAAYADDVGIFISHKFGHDIVTLLQCALNNLVQYYDKWKIKLNLEKTQAIFFTRKRKSCFLPTSNLIMNGNSITWLDNVKYLGIFLDKKLIFNIHITNIISKVNLYKKILYPLINRKSKLSNYNKIIIMKVIFQSIILYGCPVWGTCAMSHLKKLQVCQNKLLKMILNLPWHYSTYLLHQESNTSKIVEKIENITHKFKISCEMSANDLVSNLYRA